MKVALSIVLVYTSLLCCSCGSKAKTRTVTPRSLTESFRVASDSAARQYVGQRIGVPVRIDHAVIDDKVVFVRIVTDRPHCLEFTFPNPVGDIARKNIVIVGVCDGHTDDGTDRGLGVTFVIRFSNCRIE